jgi:VanZ family protein
MMPSNKVFLAGYVALAYTLVIVYASLQPFTGWRMPPAEVLGFLTAPWPRYVTATDIVLNVAAYLPLGAMLFFALRPPLAPAIALIIASLLAALLSLALESAQMFLPTRIASNVDLMTNSAGAAAGALAVMLLTLWNNPLAVLRARAVRAGTLGDCGLIVIALWAVIQLQPSPLAFSSGNLRDAFGITPMFMHSSWSYLLAESAVVALAVLALGLTVSLVMKSHRYALIAMGVTIFLTAAAKIIAALAFTRNANPLQWLTPGVATGFAAGVAGVALVIWLPPRVRAIAAALCVTAGVIIVNITPDNPYQSLPAFLSTLQPTHLANFGGIVHILSQCWPLAAILLLLGLAFAGPDRRTR